MDVSLCWQTAQTPTSDLAGDLRLLDQDGQPVVTHSFTIGSRYPMSRWKAGDVVRDQLTVRLPATLMTNDYRWTLSVAGEARTLGALRLTAPQRLFTGPPVTHTLNAKLGPVTVFGANLPEGAAVGDPLPVTLVWKADDLMPESYRVFLHLLNTDGALGLVKV